MFGLYRRSGPCIAWLVDSADETDPLAWDGTNEPLLLAVVADRVSRGIDPAVQRRVRDDPSSPHQFDEIIAADDAVAAFQQVNQQVEHLRLHRNRFIATAKLSKTGIKDV